VHVLQGERQLARDNRTLGKFQLVGLPSAPRGVPQIEVTFDIDANGIVNVAAQDKVTGKEQKITISGSSGLSKEEVAKLVRDAETHAAEDKVRREVIDVRNQAESLAWSVEKTLTESRDKLTASDAAHAEQAIAAVREAVKGDDADAIKRAADELQRASHAIAEALYKSQGGGSGEPRHADQRDATEAKDAEVVDAEFAESA
jgi:molecular chaperone DnaK